MKRICSLFLAIVMLLSLGLLTGAADPDTAEDEAEETEEAQTEETEDEAAEDGSPEADFERLGIECVMEVGESYPYETVCGDGEHRTTGEATITDYQIVHSDDEHEAKEGYEWRIVTMRVTFSDKNACAYGANWFTLRSDYYDIHQYDDTMVHPEEDEQEFSGSDRGTFTVTCDGQDMEASYIYSLLTNEWQGNTCVLEVQCANLVPEGYDGLVFGLVDAALDSEAYLDEIYDPEHVLIFRLA